MRIFVTKADLVCLNSGETIEYITAEGSVLLIPDENSD